MKRIKLNKEEVKLLDLLLKNYQSTTEQFLLKVKDYDIDKDYIWSCEKGLGTSKTLIEKLK